MAMDKETKEYLESQFGRIDSKFESIDAQFAEMHNRFDNVVKNMASKADLQTLKIEMQEYTDFVLGDATESIIEAVDDGFKKVDIRLTRLEGVKQI